jgi:hypothetical protein
VGVRRRGRDRGAHPRRTAQDPGRGGDWPRGLRCRRCAPLDRGPVPDGIRGAAIRHMGLGARQAHRTEATGDIAGAVARGRRSPGDLLLLPVGGTRRVQRSRTARFTADAAQLATGNWPAGYPCSSSSS